MPFVLSSVSFIRLGKLVWKNTRFTFCFPCFGTFTLSDCPFQKRSNITFDFLAITSTYIKFMSIFVTSSQLLHAITMIFTCPNSDYPASVCSYEEEEMKQFVLHLLVLSHSYIVPSLKRVCEHVLEQGWLTKENVIDVLQLAKSCDAPRLALICLRIVLRDFKCVSRTEAWKVMQRANPSLEQELLESVVEADSVSYYLSFFIYSPANKYLNFDLFFLEETREAEESRREESVHPTTRGDGGSASHLHGWMQDDRSTR